MPVPNSRRREYLKEYFREYNKREQRRAYLNAKQREYRGTKSPKPGRAEQIVHAAELFDSIRVQSAFSIAVGNVLRGSGDEQGALK